MRLDRQNHPDERPRDGDDRDTLNADGVKIRHQDRPFRAPGQKPGNSHAREHRQSADLGHGVQGLFAQPMNGRAGWTAIRGFRWRIDGKLGNGHPAMLLPDARAGRPRSPGSDDRPGKIGASPHSWRSTLFLRISGKRQPRPELRDPGRLTREGRAARSPRGSSAGPCCGRRWSC